MEEDKISFGEEGLSEELDSTNQDPDTPIRLTGQEIEEATLTPERQTSPERHQTFGLNLPNNALQTKLEREIIKALDSYDQFQIPPSLEDALFHSECCKYGLREDLSSANQYKICPCCYNIKTKPFSMCTPTEKLDFSGATIPLFFQLSKFLILYTSCLCLFAIVGEYFIIKTNCSLLNSVERCKWTLATLLDHKIRDSQLTEFDSISRYLLALMTGFGFLAFSCYLKSAYQLEENIDKGMVTAADYTIMMYDIAPENESKEYIENYLNSLMRANGKPPVEVMKINIAKFEGNILRLQNQIKDLYEAEAALYRCLKKDKSPTQKIMLGLKIKLLQEQQNEIIKKIEIYKKRIDDKPKFLRNSIAFVTLRTQQQVENFAVFDTISRKIRWQFSKIFDSMNRNQKIHYVSQAGEPDDIKWKFIGYTTFRRGLTYLISNIATLAAIFGCLLLHSFIHSQKLKVVSTLSSRPSSFWIPVIVKTVEIICGSVTSLINFLLTTLAVKLSRYEKHLSHSMYELSLTRKLTLLQFINSAVIPLIYSNVSISYGSTDELHNTIFYNEISNLFIGPLLYRFAPVYLLKRFKQIQMRKRLINQEQVLFTQKDLNLLFEPPEVDIYMRYCNILRSFFVACFFFYVTPLCMLICLLFLAVQFVVDKFMILNRNKRMPPYHRLLSLQLAQISKISIILIAFSNYYFRSRSNRYRGTDFELLILSISLGIFIYQTLRFTDKAAGEKQKIKYERRTFHKSTTVFQKRTTFNLA